MSNFCVQLVEAETKHPFKEHYKDGHTYVEVEPKAQYFIKIQRKPSTWEKEPPKVKVVVSIDGSELVPINGRFEEPRFKGSSECAGGVYTTTAFQFGTPVVSDSHAAPVDISFGLWGKVSVKIFETTKGARKKPGESDPNTKSARHP
jgi:hypothetical protein